MNDWIEDFVLVRKVCKNIIRKLYVRYILYCMIVFTRFVIKLQWLWHMVKCKCCNCNKNVNVFEFDYEFNYVLKRN